MKKGHKRLQFDFSKEAIERIDFIIAKTDAVSKAEAVRRSLKIYHFLVAWAAAGYDVEIKKDDHTILIPKELL